VTAFARDLSDRLASRLVDEEVNAENLRKQKASLENELAASEAQHRSELDAQKQAFNAALQKAQAEQVRTN